MSELFSTLEEPPTAIFAANELSGAGAPAAAPVSAARPRWADRRHPDMRRAPLNRCLNRDRRRWWGVVSVHLPGVTRTIYTAYTFTAVPGAVFTSDGVGFYALPYTVLISVIAFILLPRPAATARAHRHVTVADFVRERYGSPLLSLAVALTGIFATMPYIALDLLHRPRTGSPCSPAGCWAWWSAPAWSVVEALRNLPTRQREALVLRSWMDLREREIAEAMGISSGAVKSHLSRGMHALSRALETTRR